MKRPGTKSAFDDLGLDEDVHYPVPMPGGAVLRLPREMTRNDRRLVLRVVERSAKHGQPHPYKGRMGN